MKKRKILWLLVISALGCLVIVDRIMYWKEERINQSIDIAKHKNDLSEVRDKLGVPPIEPGWVVAKHDSAEIYWVNRKRGIDFGVPSHVSKTIRLEKGVPKMEEDDFHFEMNDSIAYRLVLCYTHLDQKHLTRSSNEFITYHRGKYPPSSKKVVTNHFADSVLNRWGFGRYSE